MHPEKSWFNQIQNGPLSAIIYFHMPNILQTMLVHYYKTKFEVSGEDTP